MKRSISVSSSMIPVRKAGLDAREVRLGRELGHLRLPRIHELAQHPDTWAIARLLSGSPIC